MEFLPLRLGWRARVGGNEQSRLTPRPPSLQGKGESIVPVPATVRRTLPSPRRRGAGGEAPRTIPRVRILQALLLTLAVQGKALAHNGPPFPILEKRAAGPYLVSIWADPDVGQGTFHVFLDTPAGTPPPPTPTSVKLGVQPVTHRLPLVEYPANRGETLGREGYIALPQFDQEEKWRILVTIAGPTGNNTAEAEVLVTPQGPSLAEFFLYLLPFLAAGYLWISAFLRGRKKQSLPPPEAPPTE